MKGGDTMKKLFAYLLLVAPALVALPASAQGDIYGVNDLQNANLGTRDLRETIVGIINIVLGFLGILATLIILIGGFKWMTSQGSSDKVDEAKKMIGAGIVGLLIVLASYAIARYVLNQLQANVA